MKQRLYIDINTGTGRMSFKHKGIPHDVSELILDMSYFRVHASVVYSNISKDYSFIKGNSQLIESINENERLYGIATVIPHIQYEHKDGFSYYDTLINNGFRGFKLYPRSFGHGFDPFYLKDLYDYLAGKKIPLIVDAQEVDWKDLKDTLEAFPDLNIVLSNTSWGTNRFLFPLMGKFNNLYFDLSSNQAFNILDTCKEYFGLDRILFGTNYPHKSMGGIKALIEYSFLSDDDKDKVSYINASRLFNISNILPYDESECTLDEIALKMDYGMPLDGIKVIDSHAHLVDKEHITVSDYHMINGDEDNLIRKMDQLGIDKTLISPWEGLTTDGISANETSVNVMKKYGSRFETYAMCNPNYLDDISLVEKYHSMHGFIGLKPYFYYNKYDLLGDKYNDWFEYGNKNGLIMLIHSGMEGVAEKADKLSEKYGNMSFLLAHSGASYETAMENIKVAKKRPNVYLEITYTSLTNNIIEYMVSEIGADRVIFGTDMPMRDPAPQLAWVCYARIPLEQKKKILGENIDRLISRCFGGL